MICDGVLFDLDGTLWDSVSSVTASWNQSLRDDLHIPLSLSEAEVRGVMGLTAEEIADRFLSGYPNRKQEVVLTLLEKENDYIRRHGAAVYPGVRELFSSLSAELPLFLVSNCMKEYLLCFEEVAGVEAYVTDWACIGSPCGSKAENIRHLVNKYSLSHPVYVGDTEKDEAAAKEAGCRFIHAAYGFGSAERPDGVIRSLPELPGLLTLEAAHD